MPKLQEWFLGEMRRIEETDITPPDRPVEDGELVVGKLLDPDLRKMYTLWTRLDLEMKTALVDLQYAALTHKQGPRETPEQHNKTCPVCSRKTRLVRQIMRVKVVETIFWASVSQELDDTGFGKSIDVEDRGGTIGLRENWTIVAVPNENPLVSALEMLTALN